MRRLAIEGLLIAGYARREEGEALRFAPPALVAGHVGASQRVLGQMR